jgi:DNA-directed RNA polymerase sigma subunit (sigma70/sigma32)
MSPGYKQTGTQTSFPPKEGTMSEDVLQLYRQEMAAYEVLSAPEERALAIRSEAGDQQVMNRLVEANQRLVVTLALMNWH